MKGHFEKISGIVLSVADDPTGAHTKTETLNTENIQRHVEQLHYLISEHTEMSEAVVQCYDHPSYKQLLKIHGLYTKHENFK